MVHVQRPHSPIGLVEGGGLRAHVVRAAVVAQRPRLFPAVVHEGGPRQVSAEGDVEHLMERMQTKSRTENPTVAGRLGKTLNAKLPVEGSRDQAHVFEVVGVTNIVAQGEVGSRLAPQIRVWRLCCDVGGLAARCPDPNPHVLGDGVPLGGVGAAAPFMGWGPAFNTCKAPFETHLFAVSLYHLLSVLNVQCGIANCSSHAFKLKKGKQAHC